MNGAGQILTRDLEKSKVVNAFLASVFTGSKGIQESQTHETRGKVWSNGDLSSVKENHIRKDLNWTYTSPWNLVVCNYEC